MAELADISKRIKQNSPLIIPNEPIKTVLTFLKLLESFEKIYTQIPLVLFLIS